MSKIFFSSFESYIFDENEISDVSDGGLVRNSPSNPDEDSELDLFPTAKPLSLSYSYSGPGAPPQYTSPSYRAAGEYRELLLPRRIYDENQPTKYRLARPGELMDEKGHPAVLYNFWRTPAEALDEFGIGVSLYFRILRVIIFLFLLCSGISILALNENRQNQITTKTDAFNSKGCIIAKKVILPTINDTTLTLFPSSPSSFSSSSTQHHLRTHSQQEYSTLQDSNNNSQNNNTEFVVYTPFRILGSAYGTTAHDLKFYRQGLSDILISSILVLFTAIAGMAMKHQIQKIDVSQQTTKDYSVVITNPPPDIDDPQEYYDFFSQFGEIVLVTVAKDNGQILRIFGERNRTETTSVKVDQSLRMLFSNQKKTWIDHLKIYFFSWWKIYLHTKSNHLEQQLYHVSHVHSKPWQVFITFNKEFCRDACLEAMAVGKLDIWFNQYDAHGQHRIFHDTVLRVKIAEEPTDIIYFNNDFTYFQKIRYGLLSYLVCLIFLYLALFVVRFVYLRFKGIVAAGIITIINTILPFVIKVISQRLEKHHTDGDLQSSILLKLIVTRCINGSFFVLWVNRQDLYSSDALEAIQNILIAENIAIFIRLSNIQDILLRYTLSFFDMTQTEMNSKWQGAEWTLAERFSDCLKNIFFTLFYCVPLPSLFFVASITFINTYFVDKYCLYRLWKRKPANGESIGKISRHFLTFSVFAHIIMAIFFFSNWPVYSHCLEIKEEVDLRVEYSYLRHANDDRFVIVRVYILGLYTAFLMLAISLLVHLSRKIGKIFTPQKFTCMRHIFDMNSKEFHPIEFRDIEGAAAYIPQYHPPDLLNPIFGCDMTELPIQFSPLASNSYGEYTADPRDFSIYKQEYFKYVSSEGLKKLFSCVVFYEDPFRLREKSDDDDEDGSPNITHEEYASSSYLEDVELPSGWMSRQCSDGRIFYVDLNSETITWKRPAKEKCLFKKKLATVPNKMEQYSRKANSVAILPPGWEVAYNSSNVQYFIDHNTKKTYWHLPESVIHPEPLPEYDSDEETTASSVISYLSQKSMSGFKPPSFKSEGGSGLLKSIGKSVKHLFGMKSQDHDSNYSLSSPRDVLDRGGVNGDVEEGHGDIQLTSPSLFQQHGSDDSPPLQTNQNGNREEKDDEAEGEGEESKTPSPSRSTPSPTRPMSVIMRRVPNSNVPVNLSIKQIHDSSNDKEEEQEQEDSHSTTDPAIGGQDHGEIDSINEFPVLKLAELSPTSNSLSNLSVTFPDLSQRESFEDDQILGKTEPETENNRMTSVLTTINSSCKKNIENDVLAFVYGVDSRGSVCSEEEKQQQDRQEQRTHQQEHHHNHHQQQQPQKHKHQHQQGKQKKATGSHTPSSPVPSPSHSPSHQNPDPDHLFPVGKTPYSESKEASPTSSISLKKQKKSSGHDTAIPFFSSTAASSTATMAAARTPSDPTSIKSFSREEKLKESELEKTISKTDTADNFMTPPLQIKGKTLPPGWQECVTPRGKLFYINHNDRTTHWTLPSE